MILIRIITEFSSASLQDSHKNSLRILHRVFSGFSSEFSLESSQMTLKIHFKILFGFSSGSFRIIFKIPSGISFAQSQNWPLKIFIIILKHLSLDLLKKSRILIRIFSGFYSDSSSDCHQNPLMIPIRIHSGFLSESSRDVRIFVRLASEILPEFSSKSF